MLDHGAAAARYIRLLAAMLMLAAGLSAVTLVTSASPARADNGYTIDLPPSGGGNPNGGTSTSWNPNGGSVAGGVGVSLYKVRSKWDDRIDLAKRNAPAPMGFYTSSRWANILRDGSDVATRNVVGWSWQGSPCKSDKKVVGGITTYPAGMDWTQRVRWIYDGNWYGMSESAYQNLDRCVSEATYATLSRVCPVKAYDSTLTGPYSTAGNPLPPLTSDGKPRNVPLSSAPVVPLQSVKTNDLIVRTEDGKSVAYTTFGAAFSDKARWDALNNAVKIRDVSGCPPLSATYEMPNLVSPSSAAEVMGNYKAATLGVSVECKWNVTRPYELAYTNPESTGVGSFAAWKQTYVGGDGYRGISWQGCNPVQTVRQELSKNVTCQPDSPYPFTIRNGLGVDFVGALKSCEETSEEWKDLKFASEAHEAQCVVPPGQSEPTLTTAAGGGKPGETSAGNGTTIMADGKPLRITWPASVATGPSAGSAKGWTTTYTLSGGGYPPGVTGLKPSDPFSSNVSMAGGTAPSSLPLELQFFRAGGVVTNPDQSGTPQKVRIDAERNFVFTKKVRNFRINLTTNEVVFVSETDEDVKSSVPCRYSAEFYVARVRNAN